MHTHVCKQVHKRLQTHSENAQSLTVESLLFDLLRCHYRLGNLSLKLIKAMVEVVLLTKDLIKAPIPKYTGCIFSAMIKKPWCSKGNNNGGQVG